MTRAWVVCAFIRPIVDRWFYRWLGNLAGMLKDESRSFAPLTPLRGAPSCSARMTRAWVVCAFIRPIVDRWFYRWLGHPARILKDESRSFAPLTPLRGAPSCSAQDDKGLGGFAHAANC
jgi:hypothetical protein